MEKKGAGKNADNFITYNDVCVWAAKTFSPTTIRKIDQISEFPTLTPSFLSPRDNTVNFSPLALKIKVFTASIIAYAKLICV